MVFKNDNQDIIKELSAASYQDNRQRNKILVLAVALSVFLLYSCFSLTSGKMYSNYLIDVRGMGTLATVSLENGSERQYKKMRELPYLKYVGVQRIVASADYQTEWKGKLTYLDEEAYEKMMKPAYTDIEGVYPQKEKDLMMSRQVLTQMGIEDPKIGMEIILKVEFTDGSIEEKSFLLCGYYTDYTDYIYREPEIFISSAFLEKKAIAKFPADKILAVQEDSQEGMQTEQRLYADLPMEYDNQQVTGENPMVMQSIEGMFGSRMIAIVCGCIVILCAYMLIYNVFFISMGRDIRQYGLLKTLGTTNAQLREIWYRQNLRIVVWGIVLGGTTGCLFVKLFLPKVLNNLFMKGYGTCDVSGFYPLYLIGAFGLAFFVSFLAVGIALRWVNKRNAIETLRYIETDESTIQNNAATKGSDSISLSKMAWRNVRRSKKKLCFTVFSLILGCLTALGAVVIMRGTDTTNAIMEKPDFQMGIWTGIFRYSDKVPGEINDETPILSPKTVDTILNTDGIQRETVIFTKGSYAMINFTEDEALFPRKESLDNEVQELSFATLQIVNEKFVDQLEDYVNEYNFPVDIESFRNGNGVILLHHHELSQILEEEAKEVIGKSIHFYSLNANCQEDTTNYIKGELSCAGYLDMTQKHFPELQMTSIGNKINYFIMTERAFKSLGFLEKCFDLSFDVKKEEELFIHQKLIQIIQKENQSGNNMDSLYLSAISEELTSKQNEIRTANLILGVLSAVIFFVGIMNYFNTIVTGLTVRAREIAVMESLGLTRRQLRKMLFMEGVWYWLIVMGGVVTFGTGILWMIGRVIKKKLLYFKFIYPWEMLFLLGGVMLLVCGGVAVYMYVKNYELSIAEKLRELRF